MNHLISTIHLILTICFLQDYTAANLETRPLSRLAVTDGMIYDFYLQNIGRPGFLFVSHGGGRGHPKCCVVSDENSMKVSPVSHTI